MVQVARKLAALPRSFTAIDFETADYRRDSACAVALVKVVDLRIVAKWTRLIRPPRKDIVFSYIHGITWAQLADQPTFAELWPEFARQLDGAAFFAAHSAGFDRSILKHCCAAAKVAPPVLPFHCTVQMARQAWNIFPTKLPDVCRKLNIPLKHHQAESDAEACAHIVIAALRRYQES